MNAQGSLEAVSPIVCEAHSGRSSAVSPLQQSRPFGAPLLRLSCTVVLLVGACAPASQRPGFDPEMAGSLDALLPRVMERTGVPGLAVAVVDGGAIVYDRGFGVRNAATGQPVTSETVFEAASLSKPVFAWRVLELVQRGRLDLDRPLSAYIEEPWIDDPRLDRVTARRVLAHSSGLPNWRPGRWGDDPRPLEFEFEPGSRFGYSGEGYVYLQAVVEEIVGKPLDEDLAETVFEPLGMEQSSFVWLPSYRGRAATGHSRDGAPTPKSEPREPLAAATLHTTAGDFARFLLTMLTAEGREAERGDRMLTPTTWVAPNLSWGLGWALEEASSGEELFWHWGDNDVFKSLVFGSRSSGLAAVCLTNSAAGLALCRPVIEAVFPTEHPALKFWMLNY